jgi:hypothetical protein
LLVSELDGLGSAHVGEFLDEFVLADRSIEGTFIFADGELNIAVHFVEELGGLSAKHLNKARGRDSFAAEIEGEGLVFED